MSIELQKLVNINIQAHKQTVSVGTRGIVTLLYNSNSYPSLTNDTVYESAADIKSSDNETLKRYLKIFFDLGGDKVILKEYEPGAESEKSIFNVVKSLPNEYILITVLTDALDTVEEIYSLGQFFENAYGINEKLFLGRTNEVPTLKLKNVAMKYCSHETPCHGIEMAMAAYLSRINVYEPNSVQDYMFTREISNYINIEDTVNAYDEVVKFANVNVDLNGVCRNLGGNCTDGSDLVNNFVRIVLHQTLTEKLINLLSEKIKGNSGISKIYSVITSELNKYLISGYISTDKIWTDEDYEVIDISGKKYTIISKNTPLINGYLIKVLPYSSSLYNHSTPPIYIILADSYGIRKIEISGEII